MNFFKYLFYLLIGINVVMSTCLLVSKNNNEKKESSQLLKSEVDSGIRTMKSKPSIK